MKDMNKVILIGRLGADPVQRETKSGFPVTQFPLATSRKFRPNPGGSENAAEPTGTTAEEPGAVQEETVWHKVVVWGRQAATCFQHLKKGDLISVDGSIRTRKYEGKDGAARMAFEVHAETVGFLGGRRRNPLSVDGQQAEEVSEEAVSA